MLLEFKHKLKRIVMHALDYFDERRLTKEYKMEEDIANKILALQNRLFALELAFKSQQKNNGTTFIEDVVTFFSKGIESPLFQRYVNYAVSSLDRGKRFVKKYNIDTSYAKCYLDIGCAYGGNVLAAAQAGVPICVGIDIDERLLELAKKQASELGLSKAVNFHYGDLTKAEEISCLGQFDLVTCIDVLEHVLDPEAAIISLAQLCAPGGTVFIDIPNKHSYQQIEKDPHHQLFGSILLDRENAIRVFEHVFPRNKRYTVGYFYTLDWYLSKLNEAGFTVEITDKDLVISKEINLTIHKTLKLKELNDKLRIEQRWPDWRSRLIGEALDNHLKKFTDNYNSLGNEKDKLHLIFGTPVFHLKCSLNRD